MQYKNMCKFPVYVGTIYKSVKPNETFVSAESSEIKKLLKEDKIQQLDEKPKEEIKIEETIEHKPKKRGKTRKTFEKKDDEESSDIKKNPMEDN